MKVSKFRLSLVNSYISYWSSCCGSLLYKTGSVCSSADSVKHFPLVGCDRVDSVEVVSLVQTCCLLFAFCFYHLLFKFLNTDTKSVSPTHLILSAYTFVILRKLVVSN